MKKIFNPLWNLGFMWYNMSIKNARRFYEQETNRKTKRSHYPYKDRVPIPHTMSEEEYTVFFRQWLKELRERKEIMEEIVTENGSHYSSIEEYLNSDEFGMKVMTCKVDMDDLPDKDDFTPEECDKLTEKYA